MSTPFNVNLSTDNLTELLKDGLGTKITESIVRQVYLEVQSRLSEDEIKAFIRCQVEAVTKNYLKASTGIYENMNTGQIVININLNDPPAN